jgi:hypothetical protein
MDPRIFAPWIRANNQNTLQQGVTGGTYHVQTPAFIGGRSLDPIQRAGMSPVSYLTVQPASRGRASSGERTPAYTGLPPAPTAPRLGPLDPNLATQLV